MFSAYTSISDGGILAAAILGLFGIVFEGFSYFGIYRLMAERAPKYAHRYRAGIFGYLIFGGCGFHVPVCAIVFLMKHGFEDALVLKYALYFVLPAFVLFWIFFAILEITQIQVFAKGLTPYPKWCWVFSLPIGIVIALLFNIFGNHAWVNAISCAWISVGNLWMFLGLILTMRRIKK